MTREFDFKPWYGRVRFFAYTPSNRPYVSEGVARFYDPATVVSVEAYTLGLDGIE